MMGYRSAGKMRPGFRGDAPGDYDWLIVGLGNPGRRYAGTRHNIGFRVLDKLAEKEGIPLDRLEHQALSGRGRIGEAAVILAKPMTFMNLSGESVRRIVAGEKIDPGRMIVVHDDVDFPLGILKIKTGGGAGGHNGIKSLIDRLGRSDFIRIRMGIGRPGEGDLADYVLSRFRREEVDQVEEMIMKAVGAVCSILETGVEKTMNGLHGR